MSNLIRVLALAFAVSFFGFCFSFVIGSLISAGGAQRVLMGLSLVGLYPFFLTWTHATVIELFIAKDLKQPKMASAYAKEIARSKVEFLYAHAHLLRLLSSQLLPDMDESTYKRGLAMARRHRRLASMVWWGMSATLAGIVVAGSLLA